MRREERQEGRRARADHLPSQAPPSSPEALLAAASGVVQLYRTAAAPPAAAAALAAGARAAVAADVAAVSIETCYNIELASPLTPDHAATLAWLLRETFEPKLLTAASALPPPSAPGATVVEVGPRLSFQSAWSTNAVSVCASCGLGAVTRLEPSRRFAVSTVSGRALTPGEATAFAALVHDRMTEQVYPEPLPSFRGSGGPPPAPRTVPLLARGRDALAAVDKELGLAFDEQDVEFYLGEERG